MTTSDRRFIYLLNVAQRRVQHWTREQFGDITAAQAGALFLLDQADGVLIGDVGRMLGIGAPATTGLLDRMEAAGLVERRPDANDGRATRLLLTSKGRTARVAAKARATAINIRLVDGFSDTELDTVARWLRTVDQRFAKENDT